MLDLISGLIQLLIIVAIVFAVVAFIGYNKLRRFAEDVKEAASNIKVAIGNQVKIVNDLTAMVLRYHEDEKLTMLKVSEDLAVASLQSAYQQANAVLSTIQGVVQRYPELKSNQQFNRLMDSVEKADSQIHQTQTTYNAVAKAYNVKRGSFPTVFYASTLGFGAAQYLDFDSMNPQAGTAVPLITDDGERVRQIMGVAGTKALEGARSLAHHGREVAEKTLHMVQSGNVPGLGDGGSFTYLDEKNTPQGPLSRAELEAIFRAGRISADTKVLKTGAKEWVVYREL